MTSEMGIIFHLYRLVFCVRLALLDILKEYLKIPKLIRRQVLLYLMQGVQRSLGSVELFILWLLFGHGVNLKLYIGCRYVIYDKFYLIATLL